MAFMRKFLNILNMNNSKISEVDAIRKIEQANQLSNIVNTTIDKEEFYNSINEIKNILTELSKYEGKLPFVGSPSIDLKNLEQIEKKQIELLEKRIAESKKQSDYNIHFKNYQKEEYYTTQNKKLNSLDSYTVKVGYLIIEKDKASIGMIQRVFKVGFNRATKIMGELEIMGVVGAEEGTAPRKVLVTKAQYERMVEKYYSKDIKSNIKNSQPVYATFEELKSVMEENFGISIDYSKDGISLYSMRNIIVPSTSNESQIKSINALLKYNSPETMKLILIDDSIISFNEYNGLPQLLIPIVTDIQKSDGVIQWCSSEMERRIRKFVEYRVKNIEAYNEKLKSIEENILPRIIVIVNETRGFFQRISTSPERMFMNSNMVGIYFILFSRFTLKSLSLGIISELFEVCTADKLLMRLSQPTNINDDQCITKNFDGMTGHQFERFCANALKNNGFCNVEVTQGSGDHGIDILAEKDDITYAIQCKCYSSDIGNTAIQQAHTGKSLYHKDIAVVMTNQHFTSQAINEAKQLGVKLWDKDKLDKMITKQD